MDSLEHWQIDPEHSALRFSLGHLVVQELRGVFYRWGGTLALDRTDPARSQVHVWVDLASVDTGTQERDAHVRSAEFFDVARFPRAELRSTSVTLRDGSIEIVGELDLHGTGRQVRVVVGPLGTWTDSEGRAHASYLARAKIDRQAFALHWNQDLDHGGVVVSDTVEILAEVALVRVADAAAAIGDAKAAARPTTT